MRELLGRSVETFVIRKRVMTKVFGSWVLGDVGERCESQKIGLV